MKEIIDYIRKLYNTNNYIPLHEPRFWGNEKKYIEECIDSTVVSSVGKYIEIFENKCRDYVNAKYTVAAVNGTCALHISLILAEVKPNDLVITQPLSFVATCNAITYVNAEPLFIDIDKISLGLSYNKLEEFLITQTYINDHDGYCYHKKSNRRIKACIPMHTFGHCTEIDKIVEICSKYNIIVIEDAAEAIGSRYKSRHAGTYGLLGILSFNGNKIITLGGGGLIITNDEKLAKRAKHLTTQAKIPHKWNFEHDETGYNYRLPNLNAALGCAQMENLEYFLNMKRELSKRYEEFFSNYPEIQFVKEPPNCRSNYWLNAILFKDEIERDKFLEYSNNNGVMTRPAWKLMPELPMFKKCITENIDNAKDIAKRLVNIPSSVIRFDI